MEHVYALHHSINGVKKYFYVGRSERSPEIRFREHQRNADTRTEDVYAYIRNNCIAQVFEQEILCYCDEFNPNDYEDFYVIQLIRSGHNLQNMKHGDEKHIALTAEANELTARNITINTVKDLQVYREGERARKLQEQILQDKGSPALRAMLDKVGKVEQRKKVSKKKLIKIADELTEQRRKR